MGSASGRDLGFPTANLRIERRRTPLQGNFSAVRVHGIEANPVARCCKPGLRAPLFGGVQTLLRGARIRFLLGPVRPGDRSGVRGENLRDEGELPDTRTRSSSRFIGTPRRRGAY